MLLGDGRMGGLWMIRIRAAGPEPLKHLLTSADYEKLLEEQHA